MKMLRLLPVFALFAVPVLRAAETPAPAAKTTPAADLSAFKTADELWTHLEKLQVQPTTKPTSRAEALQMATQWLGAQREAARGFAQAYPEDARRWAAKMLALRATAQLRRFGGEAGSIDADRQELAEISAAPDAPANVKGEATFMSVMLLTAAFDAAQPETFAAFHQAAGDFLEKYPEHPLASRMKTLQLRALNDDPSPAAEELLKKFASGADARLAEPARATLERRQKMADLKIKPVELKFTATDGQEIDLAQLRGKVVLVDFWASWCGPCIAEMPNVVSAYQKLHGRGFEIIGISLDQDKAAMDGAIKKQNMTWAQYFDGAGWKNKISTSFGITSIPAAWLIDKKGMLRETELRGSALSAGVEKLLAE